MNQQQWIQVDTELLLWSMQVQEEKVFLHRQFEWWKYLGIFSLTAGDQDYKRSGKVWINCNKEIDIFWEIYQAIINKIHCILSSLN